MLSAHRGQVGVCAPPPGLLFSLGDFKCEVVVILLFAIRKSDGDRGLAGIIADHRAGLPAAAVASVFDGDLGSSAAEFRLSVHILDSVFGFAA